MDAPSPEELNSLRRAAGQTGGADTAVHWQSAFGLILIETRGGQVFVNGQFVQPADNSQAEEPS